MLNVYLIKIFVFVLTLTFSNLIYSQNHFSFKRDSLDSLKASNKKVFAHYFTPYPKMINNKLPGEDYYDANFLNPWGEQSADFPNGKFFTSGGLLRERPLRRAPFSTDPSVLSYEADMEHEVRQAAYIGIDGFAIDILATTGYNWNKVIRLIEAAERIGDGFQILIVPDMNAHFKNNPDDFVDTIVTLSKYKNVYRLDDGRVVVSPYHAQNFPPSWWKSKLDELSSKGINVAFLPIYQDWAEHLGDFRTAEPEAFAKYIIGVSDWGARTPSAADNENGRRLSPFKAHAMGVKWMAPVAPQDFRPKSKIFTEAGNSENFRKMWRNAIEGDSDLVQIITWNDYSEHSSIAPSTQIGYSFYDLSAYYIQWFKTGIEPTITQDSFLGFYREHSTDALLTGEIQSSKFGAQGGEAPRNEIEMLAFLTAPATLEIYTNGISYKEDFAAGLVSYKVPLHPGKPVFRLYRDGNYISSKAGYWSVSNSTLDTQDLMYRGFSSQRDPVEDNEIDLNSLQLSWIRDLFQDSYSKAYVYEYSSIFEDGTNDHPLRLAFNRYASSGDGFKYKFLPPQKGKRLVVSFDIRTNSKCIGNSKIRLQIADQDDNLGVLLGLCEYNTVLLSNHFDNASSTVLSGTILREWAWNRVTLVLYPNSDGEYYKYDLYFTNYAGENTIVPALGVKNKIKDLESLKFVINGVKSDLDARFGVINLWIDNVEVKQIN